MQFYNVNREKLPSLTGAGFCTSTVCWTNGSWHDNWYSACAPWKRGMRVFVWNYRATRACINGLFLLVFQLWTFNGWKGACKDLLVFSNEWTSQWGIFRTTNGLAFTSINIGSWQFSPHSLRHFVCLKLLHWRPPGYSGIWYACFYGAAGKLLPECLGRRVARGFWRPRRADA